MLRALGVDVVLCADSRLCCGSAGTYSVTWPASSSALRDRKLEALSATGAQRIVSANICSIAHFQGATSTPVSRWIELVDSALERFRSVARERR